MARLRGAEGFEKHYRARFGERWDALRAALLQPNAHVERPNAFCAVAPELAHHYALDAASILAAQSLPVMPGMRVLDLCAAPGGKSLILAEKLFLQSSLGEADNADESVRSNTDPPLVLNERSRLRRARLLRVLDEYVPPEIRSRIDVQGHDATRWGEHHPDEYDAILLDAPCSSERHVLAKATALSEWSEARVSHLAVQQYSLLRSAFASLKRGGALVYATCALLAEENASVIGRLLRKVGGQCVEEPLCFKLGQPEQYGWSILPDTGGAGPMYICRLRKSE